MNHDDVIRMAREAGLWPTSSTADILERFANLVAAAEREACARMCDGLADTAGEELYYRAYIDAAAKIRARGEK